MADRGDTHYFVPKLNLWFAFSSILFLISVVWMVWDDSNGPWKEYQREFAEIEIERARAELETDDSKAALAREEELLAELAAVTERVNSGGGVVAGLQEELKAAEAEQYKAVEAFKASKEYFNDKQRIVEHKLMHVESEEQRIDLEGQLFEKKNIMDEAALTREVIDLRVSQLEAKIKDAKSDIAAAEAAAKKAVSAIDLDRKKLEQLAPEAPDKQIANILRDFPGIDFVDPNLKVRKVVLGNLTFELNFTKKTRIDMCITCHMAADLPGYVEGERPNGEMLSEPYLSHPNLDLFLSAKSPHPMSEVGCTICHRGSGESLQFTRADHVPTDEAEEHEWHEEYHWHKQHHWDYPMLSSKYIEASCIQCHKDSMDLIAPDAPKVSEGYQLFERYGCYACHKVDWYPTKRKPGPSLENLQAKLTPDFIEPWISNPKAFRPTTWMPQLFHLENFEADERVDVFKTTNAAGEVVEREIMGADWNTNAVAAVAAFLRDRAPEEAYPTVPVEGDSERGREVMRVVGCYSCHNVAPYADEQPEIELLDPTLKPGRYNEHGPNLRGVATKIKAEWLYAWIKDPAQYWPETSMPNLRLSDQDAADITAYIMEDPDSVFTDTPPGWEPQDSPYELDVLQSMAKRFFNRAGTPVLAARFAGEDPNYRWDRAEDLLVDVGEKFLTHQGCYSCHSVEGYQTTMPIGAELSNWASKTVDKLDWGVQDQLIMEHKMASGEWPKDKDAAINKREEFKHYRENWLLKKLHEPRSFDEKKIKTNPLDRLRMPWFDFTEEEKEALTTFVVGLVDDEVQLAKMVPDEKQLAMDQGLRTIRQKNCAACHEVEPAKITFEHEDGNLYTVPAQLRPLGDDTAPPRVNSIEDLTKAIQGWEEYMEEELEEVGFRLLATVPEIGATGEMLFVEPGQIKEFKASWGGDFVHTVTDYYYRGIDLVDPEPEDPDYPTYAWNLDPDGGIQDVDGEFRPYFEEPYDKIRWTFAPPVLWGEGQKLQRDWFFSFLKDPMPLRQQVRVKMPTFTYAAGEAESVADYFAAKAQRDYPSKYTRNARLALGLDLPEGTTPGYPDVAHKKTGGEGLSMEQASEGSGLSAGTITYIENGALAETAASFHKIHGWAKAEGFVMHEPVKDSYEVIARRAASYLNDRGEGLQVGQTLGVEAVNCYQCHFHNGQAPEQAGSPIAWAPDLSLTRERLREDWVRDWLVNPGLIYPGTSMPANFQGDPPQYQEAFPDSTNDQQIDAVMDWLYNFDKIPETSN